MWQKSTEQTRQAGISIWSISQRDTTGRCIDMVVMAIRLRKREEKERPPSSPKR